MNLGRLRDSDIGHWLRTDDGQAVRLIKINGPLLHVQTSKGRAYWPIHDIDRRISEEEAMILSGGTISDEDILLKKRKIVQPYKRVVRLDANGVEVVFASIKEAAEQSGISSSSVSNVCYERKKTAGGYVFRFENPEIIKKQRL